MSDKRVVWADGGIRITADGAMQVHCGKDDWRTIGGGMLIMGGTLESLARALAESEAKVERLEGHLRALADFYQRELDALPKGVLKGDQ